MRFGHNQLTELIISVSRTAAVVSCSAGLTSPCLLAAHSVESSTMHWHFWQDRVAQRHCMIPMCISGACLKGAGSLRSVSTCVWNQGSCIITGQNQLSSARAEWKCWSCCGHCPCSGQRSSSFWHTRCPACFMLLIPFPLYFSYCPQVDKKTVGEPGWLYGSFQGHFGWFPCNYVEKIEGEKALSPKKALLPPTVSLSTTSAASEWVVMFVFKLLFLNLAST